MSNHFRDSNIRPASPIVFKSGAPVSVVCVAATFTSVTYANNGGKVQLISAGVHGLTTSPAVGANIYVSWAGGTGVSGLYTVLSIDNTLKFTIDLPYVVGLGTPTVAVPSTIIEVYQQKIPPLQKNSSIRFHAFIRHTATTAYVRAAYVNFGGSLAGYLATTSGTFDSFAFLNVIKNNNDTAKQLVHTSSIIGANAGGISTRTIDTLVETTLNIQVKVNAENSVIELDYAIIEVFI